MAVVNLRQFGKELGLGSITNMTKLKSLIEKAIYKNTSCGASIQFIPETPNKLDSADGSILEYGNEGGIIVGSIVEGVDGDGTEYHTLMYPFTMEAFNEAMNAVEEEAKYIWNDTHGCDDCGVGEGELGYPAVNPNCKSCKGQGILI